MVYRQITPVVPCSDIERQIRFYTRTLGFSVESTSEKFAVLSNQGLAVRLEEVEADVDLHGPDQQRSFYVDVRGVDTLYARLKPRLDDLPRSRVHPPNDQDFGQREFCVTDEDCTHIYFGEPYETRRSVI